MKLIVGYKHFLQSQMCLVCPSANSSLFLNEVQICGFINIKLLLKCYGKWYVLMLIALGSLV